MEEIAAYDTKKLLLLLKQDSQPAFTELYIRYWKKIYTIAFNRLQNVQEAEDVVHDVFTGLWINRKKVDINLLENYLATSAKYQVLNRIKKIERQRKYNNQHHTTPVVDFPVENRLHYKKILELVKIEVERLPEKCRLIFLASRKEGLPVKEIARQFNISPKTVENQLTKALRQLKNAARFIFSFLLLFACK